DPGSFEQKVYKATDRNTPLWSIDRYFSDAEFFLSDDGAVVAVVGFGHFGWFAGKLKGPAGGLESPFHTAIEFWSKTGNFRTHQVEELCPHRQVPLNALKGDPWAASWRRRFTAARRDGDRLSVDTFDTAGYTFSMTDGRIVSKHVHWGNLVRANWLTLLVAFLAPSLAVILLRWLGRRKADRLPQKGSE